MDIRITGNARDGFAWSDGISTVSGFGSPQAALDDYMGRYGYAQVTRQVVHHGQVITMHPDSNEPDGYV